MQDLGDEAAEKLRTNVGTQIEIINVIVPLVNHDGTGVPTAAAATAQQTPRTITAGAI